MRPQRCLVAAFDLDGCLAALLRFMHKDEQERVVALPLDVEARAAVEQPFEAWPVSTVADLRWLLAERFELFLPFTATLRGRNDDLPVASRVTMSKFDEDGWLPSAEHFPPGCAPTHVAAYHDQYGLMLRLDGDAVELCPGWRGRGCGIVRLTGCADSIAEEMTEFVESFAGGTARCVDAT